MTRQDMDRYLPGSPSALLIRKTRRHLKTYGIIPIAPHWKLTWEWANKIAFSYFSAKKPWPSPSEIGAQYLALMLADMRDNFALKLPFRASMLEHMPVAVSVALSNSLPQLAIGA